MDFHILNDTYLEKQVYLNIITLDDHKILNTYIILIMNINIKNILLKN